MSNCIDTVASRAAIVLSGVGIPCAVSVIAATTRIVDGPQIEIDGSAGTVPVVALP